MGEGAKRICNHPRCSVAFRGTGAFCDKHKKPFRRWDKRKSNSNARGYGHGWRKIRIKVLSESGIPMEDWSKYDVDHNPPYNPSVDSNHENYTLIPRLRSDHSKKTASQDGGFGNRRRLHK